MTILPLSPLRPHSACTHTGRVREVNEDAILSRADLGLWVVSDGMGGHAAGDFASQTVIAALQALPQGLSPAEVMHQTRSALQDAHTRIRQEAERRQLGMIGATVVLLVLSEEHFMCLWAGDSRLYRLRDGTLEMISFDHSVVGDLVEQGHITWAQAQTYPASNQITRAVGVGETLEIDKRRGDLRPGDRFLLCSDGLPPYADDALLQRYLQETPIETVAEALLAVSLDGGAADNVSIIAVEV